MRDLTDFDQPAHSHLFARVLVFCLVGGALVYAGWAATQRPPERLEVVQPVQLFDPAELPPEPEPDEPEFEEVEALPAEYEEVEYTEAPPQEGPALADDALGLDADGGAGSDAFGLKAKRGGRALIELANAGRMDPLERFGAYAGRVASALRLALDNDAGLHGHEWVTVVELWIQPDGRISRCESVKPTGDPALDSAIRAALTGRGPVVPPPPSDLPQPVRLRITSREFAQPRA